MKIGPCVRALRLSCQRHYKRESRHLGTVAMHRIPDCIIPACHTIGDHVGNQVNGASIFARADFLSVFGRAAHVLVIKGKHILCLPQYGHQDPLGVPPRLGERHGLEHCFALIRSLRASVQPSRSVLFSFVRSFDCGRILRHPPIKIDSKRRSRSRPNGSTSGN